MNKDMPRVPSGSRRVSGQAPDVMICRQIQLPKVMLDFFVLESIFASMFRLDNRFAVGGKRADIKTRLWFGSGSFVPVQGRKSDGQILCFCSSDRWE